MADRLKLYAWNEMACLLKSEGWNTVEQFQFTTNLFVTFSRSDMRKTRSLILDGQMFIMDLIADEHCMSCWHKIGAWIWLDWNIIWFGSNLVLSLSLKTDACLSLYNNSNSISVAFWLMGCLWKTTMILDLSLFRHIFYLIYLWTISLLW